MLGLGDVTGPGYKGTTTKNYDVIEACLPEEWLLVVAFDES